MSDNHVTIAKPIPCSDELEVNGEIMDCVTGAARYINKEVSTKLDNYTCTATPVLVQYLSASASTTNSILVLCSGVPKQTQAEAQPSLPVTKTAVGPKARK